MLRKINRMEARLEEWMKGNRENRVEPKKLALENSFILILRQN